jgi:hypothetical protein
MPRTPDQEDAVAYVRRRFAETPKLAGTALSKAAAHELFDLIADAFVAGRQPKHPASIVTAKTPQTITVIDSIGTSHFHADGTIEHTAVAARNEQQRKGQRASHSTSQTEPS